MKNLKLMMMTLMMCLVGMSYGQKELDDKNGFRELTFGDRLGSIPNLILIENLTTSNSNYKYYQKTDEKLMIGDFTIKSIIYGFYKDDLDVILIVFKTNDSINSRGVLDVFENQYGKGFQSNKNVEKYFWYGDYVCMLYSENNITHNSSVYLHSKRSDYQLSKDKRRLLESLSEEKQKQDKSKNDL